MKHLVFLLCAGAVCCAPLAARAADDDAKLNAPPPGLVATNVHVADVLKLHAPAKAGTTIVEEWSYTDTGASGTERLERSGDNYHARVTLGPLVDEYGQKDGKRWHKDQNGVTMTTTMKDDRPFFGVRVREEAADPKNDVAVIGETATAPRAYVLKITEPHAKHPDYAFYDASNGNLVRFEYVGKLGRVVEAYDDFRTVDGITQAWHVHDTYPDHVQDDDYTVTSFHAGAELPPNAFDAPPSQPDIAAVTSRAALPVQITDEGYIIVRLRVNGRGMDFELDSSDSGSYIDRDVAAQLGLPTFGQATRNSTGEGLSYDTVIPDADTGPVHLHNFALRAARIAYRPNYQTKVVGFLGYDFLRANVLHVDYVNGTMEVIPPASFTGANPAPGALDIPLTMDNGVPFVPMIIGDGFTERVMLGDDWPFTLVFGQYVDAHQSQFQDLIGKHNSAEAMVPFADATDFGKEVSVALSRTPTLRFANADYSNHPVLTTDYSPENVDAALGIDYLHYFDLYFDFPHDRFLVAPNKWFRAKFTTISS